MLPFLFLLFLCLLVLFNFFVNIRRYFEANSYLKINTNTYY